jgi:hypothetical protein
MTALLASRMDIPDIDQRKPFTVSAWLKARFKCCDLYSTASSGTTTRTEAKRPDASDRNLVFEAGKHSLCNQVPPEASDSRFDAWKLHNKFKNLNLSF